MNVKAGITVVVIALAALGTTLWLRYGETPVGSNSTKHTYGYADDTNAPPLDEDDLRPKAVTDETSYQFGAMELGDKGYHSFVIKNEGEDKLVIAKGRSTCKCTVSELADNEIPPGESALIHLEWEPKSVTREFSQSARIWTNDPDRKAIDFRIEGEVTHLIRLVPGPTVNAGNVVEGAGVKTRLAIISELADEMTVPEITYNGDWLTFETSEATKEDLLEFDAKVGQVIAIQVPPTIPVGSHKEIFEIDFKVGDEEIHREVAVKCDRRGPVTIIPVPGTVYLDTVRLIDFERFPAAKGKKQSITVMINDPPDGGPVELSLKESEFPEMKVTVEPNRQLALNKRQAFNVTFEIPPGLPPLEHARQNAIKVYLHSTHPVVDEIKLYVELHSY